MERSVVFPCDSRLGYDSNDNNSSSNITNKVNEAHTAAKENLKDNGVD